MSESDYMKFRGRCRELSEDACKADPSLKLVRGHYFCPMWGKQAHWWTVRADGSVFDPSAAQFPSRGMGEYVPFDGWLECDQCGKPIKEGDVQYGEGRYVFCSYRCYGVCIGVL